MSIHKLPTPDNDNTRLPHHNEFGEAPLPFAPEVTLAGGASAVPQQFLDVRRTLQSVENILSHIQFSDKYPLFAGQQGDTVFLQVGLIGEENYPTLEQRDAVKIVYGRRWMLEPTTPTSEVVQTALLAIKKAREHELREKLVYTSADKGHVTTPFNNHLDLPLMAGKAEQLYASARIDVAQALDQLKFSSMRLSLFQQHSLSQGRVLAEVDLCGIREAETLFPEMVGQRLTVVYALDDTNAFLHGLIAALVHQSDRFVDENFRFQGFARFSHQLDVSSLADFSFTTRNIQTQDERFDDYFVDMSYQVDSSKAPEYALGRLGQLQRHAIKQSRVSQGYLPTTPSSTDPSLREPRLLTIS